MILHEDADTSSMRGLRTRTGPQLLVFVSLLHLQPWSRRPFLTLSVLIYGLWMSIRSRSPVRGRITRRRMLFCKPVPLTASLARWQSVWFSLGSAARGSIHHHSLYVSLVGQRATSRRRGRTLDSARNPSAGRPRLFFLQRTRERQRCASDAYSAVRPEFSALHAPTAFRAAVS